MNEGRNMQKKDVIAFFDRCAPGWDAGTVANDEIIGEILDNAGIAAGMEVLDVACGTGVLFPYYIKRGVASVTGIDISPEMAKLAAQKSREIPEIRVICGDVEEQKFDRRFDAIVVYNAFPHFPDARRLIETLALLLKDEGRMTIAHGASREQIDRHHEGTASKVSNGLMPAESLKELLEPYFTVDTVVSDCRMYQVSGVKKPERRAGVTK